VTRDLGSAAPTERPVASSTARFWWIIAAVVAADVLSKGLAVAYLTPRHIPHPILGDALRFTLAYNPGAAFGMHVGPASRWVFATLSMTIVVVLLRVTAELTRSSALAAVGVPIVIGGAIGNLLDRIRYREGVVDFIDIGVGDVRFWTFNVADIAVTIGAACLIVALWKQDRDERHEGHNDELSVQQ
jgi:signal peptidase II